MWRQLQLEQEQQQQEELTVAVYTANVPGAGEPPYPVGHSRPSAGCAHHTGFSQSSCG
jgi:hypothetical protein